MRERFDLVVIGMGSAGITAAEFAAILDLRVAVVERDRIGGDCLWHGCVPSKALLASAKVAHTVRHAGDHGVHCGPTTIDTAQIWQRIRAVQASIAETSDNQRRFESLGIEVIVGEASIGGPNTVIIDNEHVLDTRFILVCTGSKPTVPEIAGLRDCEFATNETLFGWEQAPDSLVIIGGGPMGIEMAQAMNRLGVRTTVLQRGEHILPADEASLTSALAAILGDEGVDIHLACDVVHAERSDAGVTVTALIDEQLKRFEAQQILVACGRQPNIDGLGLDEMEIDVDGRGIVVDGRGRTSVKTIYAVGDVVGRFRFAHAAGHDAIRAVRDMFFPGKGSKDDLIPWCTFTDPELAHAGLTVAEAERRYGDDVDVWRADLSSNDRVRAQTIGTSTKPVGEVVIVTARQRIVGAHILADNAGEMIQELSLAIDQQLRISELATLVHVYPTVSFSIGQLAAESAFEKAQRLRWLVKR